MNIHSHSVRQTDPGRPEIRRPGNGENLEPRQDGRAGRPDRRSVAGRRPSVRHHRRRRRRQGEGRRIGAIRRHG
jgi:hypothetical protein